MALKLKKRGQGLYILIGVIILFLFLVGFYIYRTRAEAKGAEEEIRILEESTIPSLNIYIKESIVQASTEVIEEIGLHGGTLTPSPSYLLDDYVTEAAYMCSNAIPDYPPSSDHTCVNALITKQNIEDELAAEIKNKLDDDVDLTSFEEQGIDIVEGEKEVTVVLGKTAVIVELHYPLTLTVKNKVEKVDTFQETIDSPLGILHELAVVITNTELQEMEFNIIEWQQKYGGMGINVNPPPDIPGIIKYTLEMDNYFFNFAVEKDELEPSDYGCCRDRYDLLCFKNVPVDECNAIGGEFDPESDCVCPTEGELSCIVSFPNAGCPGDYTEVLRMSDYTNAHASMPGTTGFEHSLCCNIVSFYITQASDEIGIECPPASPNGAVFAKLSSGGVNAHVDGLGPDSQFSEKVCISALNNKITCEPSDDICLGEAEPVLSFTQDGVNSHVGHAHAYDYKTCCKADEI